MDVKAVIYEKYKEIEIHVCNQEMNDEVKMLMNSIGEIVSRKYIVKNSRGDQEIIEEKDIIMIYTEDQKVFIRTANGDFESKNKMYELENELPKNRFVRISRAEIINIKKIECLDMGLTGTIKVKMKDGSETYSSRRNVAKLKSMLGI